MKDLLSLELLEQLAVCCVIDAIIINSMCAVNVIALIDDMAVNAKMIDNDDCVCCY